MKFDNLLKRKYHIKKTLEIRVPAVPKTPWKVYYRGWELSTLLYVLQKIDEGEDVTCYDNEAVEIAKDLKYDALWDRAKET